MKKIAFIALLAISISACEDSTEKEIKEYVASQLKDPKSTEFRNVKLKKNSIAGSVMCGELNSKNSYGAYAGFKRFIAIKAHSATDQQKNIQGIVEGHSAFGNGTDFDSTIVSMNLTIFTVQTQTNLQRASIGQAPMYSELLPELAPYSDQVSELGKTVTKEGGYDRQLLNEIANNITFDKAQKEHCNF